MKWIIALTLIGSVAAMAYVGNAKWNKNVMGENLSMACGASLASLNSKLPKQKMVSYGEFNDYVFKRVSWLQGQLKAKKLSEREYRVQTGNLFSTYAPTSMKTCQTLLSPSFQKCRGRSSAESCAVESEKAFSFGLRLVYEDSQTLKQSLDLSKVVAFDIRTAIQQTRPRMPASDKADLQNFAAFLQ